MSFLSFFLSYKDNKLIFFWWIKIKNKLENKQKITRKWKNKKESKEKKEKRIKIEFLERKENLCKESLRRDKAIKLSIFLRRKKKWRKE